MALKKILVKPLTIAFVLAKTCGAVAALSSDSIPVDGTPSSKIVPSIESTDICDTNISFQIEFDGDRKQHVALIGNFEAPDDTICGSELITRSRLHQLFDRSLLKSDTDYVFFDSSYEGHDASFLQEIKTDMDKIACSDTEHQIISKTFSEHANDICPSHSKGEPEWECYAYDPDETCSEWGYLAHTKETPPEFISYS